jgi:hypothetical protein
MAQYCREAKGVLMSDCLHCDIHEMLEVHLQAEQADLAQIAAKVTEVLADLISQEADPSSPRRSSH